MSKTGPDRWLIAGTAHENGAEPRPWLAGEGSASRAGARLIRVDRAGEQIHEYPVTGFSVLRLIALTPNGLLAGGDGMGEKPPTDLESAPGWLRLHQGERYSGKTQAPAVPPEVFRFRHLPHGELHAWTLHPYGPGGSGPCMQAGCRPHSSDRGSDSCSMTEGISEVARRVREPPPRTTTSFPPQTSPASSRILRAIFR